MNRIERALQVHFACLASLGGLMLGSGEQAESLPVIAFFLSVFAFVCVDYFRLFALPASAAYVGMGLAAIYSVGQFVQGGLLAASSGGTQLTAVAQLLVLVMAILMLQRKTRRVYEQLGIFCLLELVVAAVFNSALSFGLLLVPFALLGLSAMVLLQALRTLADPEPARELDGSIQTVSSKVAGGAAAEAFRSPWLSFIALLPAILLFAAVFFYALPRTSYMPSGGLPGGRPTIGFAEEIHLDQVGQLLQSSALVMRVALTDADEQPYQLNSGMYLRGQVLEHYEVRGGRGRWKSRSLSPLQGAHRLPARAPRDGRPVLYDELHVRISAEPLTSPALFSLPPYHQLGRTSEENVEHVVGRWLLRRKGADEAGTRSRIEYQFGSRAFHNGWQTRFVRQAGPREGPYLGSAALAELRHDLLQFDALAMPRLAQEAREVLDAAGVPADDPYRIGIMLEDHLARRGGFRYTTELDMARDTRLDPIEQFVAEDRRGHCQYFGSALTMMLRSQGIPARMVVGYKTDEFNPLNHYYAVRQLHAHAWVEALLEEHQLPESANLSGQTSHGPTWVRFDPTPGGGGNPAHVPGRLDQVLDLAQSFWNDYVMDMRSDRQFGGGLQDGVAGEQSGRYGAWLAAIHELMRRLGLDRLGGGSLALYPFFSWPAALATALGILLVVFLVQATWLGWPRWMRFGRRASPGDLEALAASSIDFYRRLVALLEKQSLRRRRTQTPREFARQAATHLEHRGSSAAHAPLDRLITSYYRVRFGHLATLEPSEQVAVEQSLQQVETLLEKVPSPKAERL